MDLTTSKLFWTQRAHEEAFENMKRKDQHGNGICSVFILDTSESMAGEGLRQMKRAFLDILNEYESLKTDDNVAVIGCGGEVKFLHYYTNNYYSIRKCIDNIECKGPSPLEAGIILAYSCIQLGGGHTVPLPQLEIRARVVVISDGNPTEITTSTESAETSTDSEGFISLLSEIKSQGKGNPFTFIPVGKSPNNRLLGALALASKGGRLIGWQDARQYARLSLNFQIASHLLCCFRGKTITEEIVRGAYPIGLGSEQDINQVCEILNEKDVYRGQLDSEDDFKERYPEMPCVGTRVRRGKDWRYENQQDTHGPGTVIGHNQHVGWINVEWDNGNRFRYRYRSDGFREVQDITVCNEPRLIPENQTIATGCLVRQGPHWKWGDQNGTEDSIGTVYRVIDGDEVYVRWPNGHKSNYRFGYNDKYDLILCDPTDPEIIECYLMQNKMNNCLDGTKLV